MELDVGVAALAIHPTQDGVVRGGAASDHVDDRQGDRDQQGLQDAHGDDTGHGGRGDGDFDPAGAGQSPPGRGVDQTDGGGHDHRAQGRRQQGQHIGAIQAGELDAGQARWDLADRGHALLGQPEGRGGGDGQDHHQQRAGNLGGAPAQQQQRRQAGDPDRHGGAAQVVELAHDLGQLGERVLGVDVEPEQLAELPND